MSVPETVSTATILSTPEVHTSTSLSETPVPITGTSDAKSDAVSLKEEKLEELEDVSLDVKAETPVETESKVEEKLKPKTASLHVDTGNEKEEDKDQSAITPTPLKGAEEAQSSTTPIGLDSLLSPKEPEAYFPLRESIVSEATDEDSRFSTVLLSARQSMETLDVSDTATLTAIDEHPGDDRRNTLSGNDLVTMVHRNRAHKKTASTSTIVSAHDVSFIPEREGESDSQRNSLDGQQQKLHEEFTRIQLDRPQEPKTTEGSPNVDWDFWGDVVSDYLKFAAERPEELAKAIERGIPKSLRGMIWQLM